MTAFDWLGDMVRWLGRFVPRVMLIRQTHRGVCFTLHKARKIGPGLVWYWPLISELVLVCIVRQTINLHYQCLITRDGKEIVIAVTVVLSIHDPLAAVTTTDDVLDTVSDMAQWGVKRVVSNCTAEELRSGKTDNNRSVDKLLRSKLGTDVAMYGVTIEQAFLNEMSFPTTVRLMGGPALAG